MTANRNERCDIQIEPGRAITIVPSANDEYLNEMQLVDYREHRWEFLQWLRTIGKNQEKRKGYSDYSVYETGYRTARFDRWAWDHEGRYTVPPEPEHADQYMDDVVAYRDVTNSTKGKIEEALMRYYEWATEETYADEWDRDQRFTSSGGDNRPRDFLTRRERQLIRDVVINSDSAGWDIASLILTSLDAAFRPIEVKRAHPGWVDVDNMMLRIPREESSKNEDNWRVSLTKRTTIALDRWQDERDNDPMYNDRRELWLTREATPWTSSSLSRLIKRLCDEAGIGAAGRSLTWYSIRHSTGTYLTEERDLKAAKDQLRHKSSKTTMKYDQVPVEDRRGALDNM
jgi:integrase